MTARRPGTLSKPKPAGKNTSADTTAAVDALMTKPEASA